MFKKSAVLGLVLACIFGSAVGHDTVPPNITAFSFPGSQRGNMVGGVVPFRVTATDDVGVMRVELYKKRVLVDTDSAPPWGASVDFNGDATGADYTVEAKAYDAAGNASTSTLTVNKPDSEMGGAGAAVVENGCFFKVWAPNADEVQLVGDFNEVCGNGAPGVDFLTENRGGYWLGFVPGCSAGDRLQVCHRQSGGRRQ